MSKVNCIFCNDTGALHYLDQDPGQKWATDYFGRCPKCESWQGLIPDFIPFIDDSLLPICRPDNDLFLPHEETATMEQLNETKQRES